MNGGNPSTPTGLLRASVLAVVLLAISAACASTEDSPDPTTRSEDSPKDLTFEEVQAGASGNGSEEPGLLISNDPNPIRNLLQISETLPDDPNRTYIAASSGLRNTGGYSVTIERITARENGRVEVFVSESEPPEDARVTQSLTYPFSVVAVEGIADSSLSETTFVAVNPDGDELGWTVEVDGE